MEEIRIDVTKQSPEELALAERQAQLVFKFNQAMPGTQEYRRLMSEIFPTMGDGSRVATPLSGVRFHMVSIGSNVVIMPGCLMMAAGGITIDDSGKRTTDIQQP